MAGNDREFLDFFADQFWSLRRVGFLLTGDWDQAEELAQEAMARTFAAWSRIRAYDRPAAYARNVVSARFVLATLGSLLIIVLLAVPSANAYFH